MANTKELLELMLKNPELKVIPYVHHDCCSDDYNYTVANFNNVRVEEYYYYGDGIYFKSDFVITSPSIKLPISCGDPSISLV